MLSTIKNKREQGFTIIEVMIVLAIAALILVVVLIAVPQLQRNQRNSARRDIAGRIKAEIDNFAGNNNGTIPVSNIADGALFFGKPRNTANSFFNRYFECGPPAVSPAACGININDPRSGFPVGSGPAGTTDNVTPGNNATIAPGALPGDIAYVTATICNGEVNVGTSNGRQYSILIRLEGNAVFCLDNR